MSLPPNAWTISPTNRDELDVSWLTHGFRKHEVLVLIENQLELLRRYDTYHRSTSPEREATKEILIAHKRKIVP